MIIKVSEKLEDRKLNQACQLKLTRNAPGHFLFLHETVLIKKKRKKEYFTQYNFIVWKLNLSLLSWSSLRNSPPQYVRIKKTNIFFEVVYYTEFSFKFNPFSDGDRNENRTQFPLYSCWEIVNVIKIVIPLNGYQPKLS